jgi:hypothetical protein
MAASSPARISRPTYWVVTPSESAASLVLTMPLCGGAVYGCCIGSSQCVGVVLEVSQPTRIVYPNAGLSLCGLPISSAANSAPYGVLRDAEQAGGLAV